MTFPVDQINGHPQYAGTLIPEVWSPRILEKFYEVTVMSEIANTDYEGEISGYGSKVIIRTTPDVEIRDYVKGMDLKVQHPEPDTVELVIDRGHYWNVGIEDVDRAQSDLNYMEDWTGDAAERMNERINEIILAEIPADFHPKNMGANAGVRTGYFDLGAAGAPVAITAANVISKLGECSAVLSEHKVPETDRWMVIPPWFKQMIYDSALRNALVTGNDQSLLRRGYVGMLAGFHLFETNQVAMAIDTVPDPDVLASNIVFGHKTCLTFASQLVNSEAIRMESRFGLTLRGLNAYGFNVNKPDAGGLLYAYRSTS